MCRHLAYLGPARSLSSLLYAPPHCLEHQSWRTFHQREVTMNPDGWGVGWWDPQVRAAPARYRTVTPMWADQSFRSVADVVHSRAILAAVRAATPPAAVVETGSAPFTAGPWLWSLNGYVTGHPGPVGEGLRRSVSQARAAALEGTTDSEVLFALALDAIDDGATPADALAQLSLRVLAQSTGPLNLLLSDGTTITATAWRNTLFTLTGVGLATGGVLLASEPLDDHPAWVQVPDGSIIEATVDGLTQTPLNGIEGAA